MFIVEDFIISDTKSISIASFSFSCICFIASIAFSIFVYLVFPIKASIPDTFNNIVLNIPCVSDVETVRSYSAGLSVVLPLTGTFPSITPS